MKTFSELESAVNYAAALSKKSGESVVSQDLSGKYYVAINDNEMGDSNSIVSAFENGICLF